MSTLSASLRDLLADLLPRSAVLPTDVQLRAQRLWIDTVSCAHAGAQAEPVQGWLRAKAQAGGGLVAVPGSGYRLALGDAACALALAACWDEACEGLALAHGRPGVPIVAALWSQVGAGARVSWAQLWRATAIGYEVAARLGARLRIRPGMHVDGVWGAFGAAAAVVALRGGHAAQILQALETCATQLPFSLYRPVRQGATVRNLYLGHSAWWGLQAADAVAAGLTSPEGALDDVAQLMLDPAGAGVWPAPGPWLMLDSYWKPFAAVRHVHYGAQAALRLRDQWRVAGIDPDHLEALRLDIYAEALQYCGNRAPDNVLSAQFSLSFGVAAALVFGDLSPAEYRAPRFDDARVRRFEALLEIRPDPGTWPAGQRGARLSARAAGRVWTLDQGPVTGDPGLEPSLDQVMAKFHRYSGEDPALLAWAQALRGDADAPARLPVLG